VQRCQAHELIIGITEDKTFGPLVLFGAGGVAVEVTADTAVALPPLDLVLADDLVRSTRVHRLLQGYRDRAAANMTAIANALVRLSALAANHPEIRELDVNPLLADERGVIALDARVRIADPKTSPRVPMAIRPYPSHWQRQVDLPGLGRLDIRPIRPEDERLYASFFEKVTPEDRRLRLLAPINHLPHGFIARLTQIDYAREIAFIAIAQDSGDMLGVVRYSADPDLKRGEFAILVRSDLKGKGLGWCLMQRLLDYARAEKLEALVGSVLDENTTMLRMCQELGFRSSRRSDEPGVTQVVLDLMT
jgi:acetyltransferase